MNIETEKLEIISEIARLNNVDLLKDIHKMLHNSQKAIKPFSRVGVVKDFVGYISDDFDDFIPEGFEEYLPTDEQVAAANKKTL
jgi:hypothetical protein